LLIGLLDCSFALVEGVANDWLALALVDGHGTSQTLGAIGLGVFVAAMTIGRLGGAAVLDRYGRAPVLRATAVLAALGVGTVVAADPLPLVIVGAVLWGLGASLGFPVGMSAAADQQDRAPTRVAVVSSIGYTAFLAGPPLVGYLAEAVGILRGLLVVVAAAGVGGLVAFATSPPARRLS
ncbi:MAG: MFS transporter, partial [Actinomycetota bacterium]|nr:MFS transporter [Actinomycetota bacterium]